MNIAYSHLINLLKGEPSIEDISESLFQLGHEHIINNDNIFDIEFTPNRGDCLSLNGLARDLNPHFSNIPISVYEDEIKSFNFNFKNEDTSACPRISFLKLKIKKIPTKYKSYLNDYFIDLKINKNNFFTDVSNYLAYETGQPTHCYDSDKINHLSGITFLKNKKNRSFETLLENTLDIEDNTFVFEQDKKIINIAGIIGGKSTACSKDTLECILECAYFNPEVILGKSLKYDIKSEASYKFERGVDPLCHEKVLRRFIKIIQDHALIEDVSVTYFNYQNIKTKKIKSDKAKISDILGIKLPTNVYEDILKKLGFEINKNINIPSYRGDIETHNDIAEEIARVIGYQNIPVRDFEIDLGNILKNNSKENNIRSLLAKEGFNEVINNPFVETGESCESLVLDNPLDSNKRYLRTNLQDSLIGNLIYNENRQNDSIKIFEFSKIYIKNKTGINEKNILAILVSGRKGLNYLDFSKDLDASSISKVFRFKDSSYKMQIIEIDRKKFETKKKSPIYYAEIDTNEISINLEERNLNTNFFEDIAKYKKISSYPLTTRDISFLLTKEDSSKNLQSLILDYKHEILKHVFVFDFYINNHTNEIKIGFRFVFQSSIKTLTDEEVNEVINDIISISAKIEGVSIPGLS